MIENDIIYGKSLKSWDKMWKKVGLLCEADIKKYKGFIGLYKIYYGKNKLYIGKATEHNKNKGLYKRLNDYLRDSDSGRNSQSAKEIYMNLDNAKIEILVVGKEKEAIFATNYLESYFIDKYKSNGNSHGKNLI